MAAEVNLFYRTATDGKARIKVSGTTFKEAAEEYVEAVGFATANNWVEDSTGGAAQKAFGNSGPKTQTTPFSTNNALVCVEDGGTISGMTVQGKRFSAEDIAAGRTKKSAELGLDPVGPRCDDCWQRGNYASRYKALKGYNK